VKNDKPVKLDTENNEGTIMICHSLQSTTRTDICALIVVICIFGAEAARRPNLIYIMGDDLGYHEVGAYGQEELLTPNLDLMAQEGMKFIQFYTGTPVCAPSRCNLMTAMHNAHCRVRDNDVNYLRPEDVTMAEVLKHAGYVTGAFGKWGLSFNDQPASYPTRQGFDRFVGYYDQRHAHNYYPTFLMDDEDTLYLNNIVPNENQYGAGNASVEADYSHAIIVEKALQFIQDNKDTSFFLYAPFTTPHINNEGAGGIDGGYEVPATALVPYENEDWPFRKKCYAAMITMMDADIGTMLAKLKETGIEGNTLVFFTSDNGPTWLTSADDGNTNVIGEWFDGNAPFHGLKSDIYEGGIRMPAIVRWPGVVPAGGTTDVIGYFPDVMPTFAALAGVAVPANIDGISLLPSILGNPEQQQDRDYVYWYYPFRNQRAVRMDNWKGVWINGEFALYDLSVDTTESNDVQAQHSGIVDQMTAINAAEGILQPIVADWTPELLEPAVRRGCMDSAYGEFDASANYPDSSACLALRAGKAPVSSPVIEINGLKSTFTVTTPGNHMISIYDVEGGLIFSASGSGAAEYGFSGFYRAGIHILKVNAGDKSIIKKFLYLCED
jgi:arylsulfatase A-like enzyme